MPPFHCLKIHFNIILPSTPWSSELYLSLNFHHQSSVYISPPHSFYMLRESPRGSLDHKPLYKLFQNFNYHFFLLRRIKCFALSRHTSTPTKLPFVLLTKLLLWDGRTDHAYTRLALRQNQSGSADHYSMHVLVSICIIDCDNESEISLSQ